MDVLYCDLEAVETAGLRYLHFFAEILHLSKGKTLRLEVWLNDYIDTMKHKCVRALRVHRVLELWILDTYLALLSVLSSINLSVNARGVHGNVCFGKYLWLSSILNDFRTSLHFKCTCVTVVSHLWPLPGRYLHFTISGHPGQSIGALTVDNRQPLRRNDKLCRRREALVW